MTRDRKFVNILEQDAPMILLDASRTLARCHLPHYDRDGPAEALRRLQALYRAVLRALKSRNRAAIAGHAESVARQRVSDGFGLRELQGAFNALEEAIWTHLLVVLPAEEFAEAIGMVSTVLGAGKDALANAYVAESVEAREEPRDLGELFKGTEGA